MPKTRDYQILQTAGGKHPKYGFNRLCLRIGQKQGSPHPPAGSERGAAAPAEPPHPCAHRGCGFSPERPRLFRNAKRGAASQRPAGAAPGSAPRLSPPPHPAESRGHQPPPRFASAACTGSSCRPGQEHPRPGGQSPAPPRPTPSARRNRGRRRPPIGVRRADASALCAVTYTASLLGDGSGSRSGTASPRAARAPPRSHAPAGTLRPQGSPHLTAHMQPHAHTQGRPQKKKKPLRAPGGSRSGGAGDPQRGRAPHLRRPGAAAAPRERRSSGARGAAPASPANLPSAATG